MNTDDQEAHDHTMTTTTLKDELLARYARRPVQRFLQLDCFTGYGDAFSSRITHELMSTPDRGLPVRVLIHEDAQREDVRRLLTKMLDQVDRSFEMLHEENERELFARAGIKQNMLIPGIDDGNGECPF